MRGRCFVSLHVENRIESQHLPVSLTVRTTQTNQESPRAEGKRVEKTIWDNSKTQLYLESLRQGQLREMLARATAATDTDVNRAVGLFAYSQQLSG